MSIPLSTIRSRRTLAAVAACVVAGSLGLSACSSSKSSGTGGGSSSKKIAVSLITKDSTNPFFVAMQKGAKEQAAKDNVDLTIGAGKADGDEQGQITLIENAIAAGQKGILITCTR